MATTLLQLDPRDELPSMLQSMGYPRFRGRQIARWVYQELATSYDTMTDLPKALRTELENALPIGESTLLTEQQTPDVHKGLFRYPDGGSAETVLLRYNFGPSVCLSSQVGCRQGCRFCATGASGFTRSLRVGEIMEQFLWAARCAKPQALRRLVMMGAGEPLDNYEAVLAFLRRLHDPSTFGLSFRHMTISTVGLVPQMIRLADEGVPINLALSLHATTDALRSELIPENRRYPIAEILSACDHYFAVTGRRITYEFLLIGDLNDDLEEAKRLAAIVKDHPGHVNLIPLNPVEGFDYEAPPTERVRAFADTLKAHGVTVTVRRTMGREVDAACGQLRRRWDKRGEPVAVFGGLRSRTRTLSK